MQNLKHGNYTFSLKHVLLKDRMSSAACLVAVVDICSDTVVTHLIVVFIDYLC